jgi:hypothetical protein
MKDIKDVIKEIRGAFGNNEYPGDAFLQGSFEGCEPFEEVGPFKGKMDWRAVAPGVPLCAMRFASFSSLGP